MAVLFKKINGFPVDLLIETKEVDELDSMGDHFKGFKSNFFLGEEKKLIKEFYHKEYRARIHWADGYFTALRLNENAKV
jgi:hypothetical protein